MKKERVLYLDLIRVIGFVVITAYHFASAVGANGIEAAHIDLYVGFNSFRWGPIALACFFMVSGAALIMNYEERLDIKEFYKKRFLGIFPLFWLAYLFAFLAYFYRMKGMPEAPKITFLFTIIGMDKYMEEFMCTFGLVGEWFMGAIIMLYILFPLYRFIMLKNKYILPVILLGAALFLSYNNVFPINFDKNPIVCSMYFVIGMLLEMLRKGKNQKVVVIGRRIAAAVGMGVYIAVYMVERVNHSINSYHRIFILALSFYMVMMEVSTWIRSERAKRLIVVLGRHSYAFYLIHHVFLQSYIPHFAGRDMSGSNTLVLFLTSVAYIYLLALGLEKIYGRLAEWICRERLVTRSK